VTAESYLEARRLAFEPELEKRIESLLTDVPARLAEAMRYGVLGGGKRLRPVLALAAAEVVAKGPAPEAAIQYGCAVEMIHAYSLIHDDLPAMDDDDLRRGRPTTHRAFGEAMAILAGDGLLTEAFALTASVPDPLGGALCRELALGAGAVGMVGGQALDIAATGNRGLPAAEIQRIHRGKTGALMAAASAGGALCGGASPALAGQLRRYGEALGMAFQAADDLLDVVGDPAQRGKRSGGDEVEEKATLVVALGVDGARARAQALAEAACDAVASLEGSQLLRELALYAASRSR
jgi:geranylgeranyl diphosphate synthase, type II